VREGDKFTLYQLEQAKFRLPGKNWLDFVGKRVAVTGTIQKKKDVSLVRVDALEVLAPSPAERGQSAIVGNEIELALKDPFGGEQRLSSLKGRIVILNFWATYCTPCRKEMPDLAAIQNEYGALGVQVIGASTDEPADRDKVMQFAKEAKVNFPIWLGATTAHMITFGLGAALPGTVIIDREGRVAKIISGVVNYAEVKKQIDPMLKGLASAARSNPNQTPEQISRTEVSSVPS